MAQPLPAAAQEPAGGAAVLIVDDEEEILHALERRVKATFPAAKVVVAQDVESALGALTAHRFGLIISDYRLRGPFDGAQLLRRAAGIQPWAARVALAADPDRYLVETSRQEGFTVLTKPIDDDLLLRLLRHHLQA